MARGPPRGTKNQQCSFHSIALSNSCSLATTLCRMATSTYASQAQLGQCDDMHFLDNRIQQGKCPQSQNELRYSLPPVGWATAPPGQHSPLYIHETTWSPRLRPIARGVAAVTHPFVR
jgi:hypothetical protein